MRRINIIGAGRVGQTLAKLWHDNGVFDIAGVLNRRLSSAYDAVKFIGAGQAVADMAELPEAELCLIATPDTDIAATAEALAVTVAGRTADIVFHASGALSSDLLLDIQAVHSWSCASVHPVMSFASPGLAELQFAGTYCGAEGERVALATLIAAFEAIGAHVFTVNAEHKTLYHAASVLSCNYLVALQELALQAYEQAGVSRDQAMQVLHPLAQATLNNVFQQGTAAALTGPIARGDAEVVAKQAQASAEWSHDAGQVYRHLGAYAAQLAKPTLDDAQHKAVLRALRGMQVAE